jgi:hypothetical protein
LRSHDYALAPRHRSESTQKSLILLLTLFLRAFPVSIAASVSSIPASSFVLFSKAQIDYLFNYSLLESFLAES